MDGMRRRRSSGDGVTTTQSVSRAVRRPVRYSNEYRRMIEDSAGLESTIERDDIDDGSIGRSSEVENTHGITMVAIDGESIS